MAIPHGYGYGREENREFRAGKIVPLQEERPYERGRNSNDRKAIALNRRERL